MNFKELPQIVEGEGGRRGVELGVSLCELFCVINATLNCVCVCVSWESVCPVGVCIFGHVYLQCDKLAINLLPPGFRLLPAASSCILSPPPTCNMVLHPVQEIEANLLGLLL